MVAQDIKTLKLALQKAKEKAEEYINSEDNGTSNFDTPTIYLNHASEKKLKEYFEEEYGVYRIFPGCYVIGYKVMEGQGLRRTRMAQAFAEALRSLGYESYVRYITD